jgi:hypothetical protein
LQVIVAPRGALTWRLRVLIGAEVCDAAGAPVLETSPISIAAGHAEGSNLRTYARVVKLKLKNFLLDFCGD